jgi:Pyruvate/2-oxoacid:ferredoxin oxidoreductase gamma subunit
MLYGMTGGQTSGLTPCGIKTTTTPKGNSFAGYDICKLAHSSKATYVRRIIGRGDFSEELAEAFKVDGFSLVEVVELCPSYGAKLNPGKKLDRIIETSGQNLGLWKRDNNKTYLLQYRKSLPSLFEKTPEIKSEFKSNIKKPFSIIIGGSAGEGVQFAAVLLARAAIASGLSVTKKGSYPVTVGVGFSIAEIIISPRQIHFHGINKPDIIIITSKDGLTHNKKHIIDMKHGMIFLDEDFEPLKTEAKVISHNFHQIDQLNTAIYAVSYFLHKSGLIPISTLIKVIQDSEFGYKIPIEKIKELLDI